MKQGKTSWHEINWKEANEYIFEVQKDIVKAYNNNNTKEIYRLQRKIITSFYGAAIAVRTVYSNSGGQTPGIDRKIWDSPQKRMKAIEEIKYIVMNPKNYNPSPVKRIMIPKSNSKELRPLGIPTMIDRAMQKLYLLALDPIIECQSDSNSFGFRMYRSPLCALAKLLHLLRFQSSARWVLETDVQKCFDKMDHQYILDNIIICDKETIKKWLKSGIIYKGEFSETSEGSPQGGIISPILCNMVLNGMEKQIQEVITDKKNLKIATKTPKVHIIRYADDIVITGNNQEILSEIVKPTLQEFLKKRGLQMKEAKTRITNINTNSIKFLGFEIKNQKINYKYAPMKKNRDDILVIRIAKEKITKMTETIRKIVKKENPIDNIIKTLNPILKGWVNYYRMNRMTDTCMRQLIKVQAYLWKKILNWAHKRHPTKGFKEISKIYLPFFSDKRIPKGNSRWDWGINKDILLFNMAKVKKWYHIFPKANINKYKSLH